MTPTLSSVPASALGNTFSLSRSGTVLPVPFPHVRGNTFIPSGPDPVAAVDRLHHLLYGRRADRDEIGTATEFLAAAGPGGWQQYVQVLLGSNEFVFVD